MDLGKVPPIYQTLSKGLDVLKTLKSKLFQTEHTCSTVYCNLNHAYLKLNIHVVRYIVT